MAIATRQVEHAFEAARERYAELGVDVERALERLARIPISLHCWQGDDVGGFEDTGEAIGGGLAVTGNYPGKARTADELRADLDKALSLIPGTPPAQPPRQLRRDRRQAGRARRARARALPRLDRLGQGQADWGWTSTPPTSPTPRPPTACTLAHPDPGIREFWIDHGIACRQDRRGDRRGAGHALRHQRLDPRRLRRTRPSIAGARASGWPSRSTPSSPSRSTRGYNLDAVEGKLFGLGSESYVVGSHEFYLGYAVTRKKLLCLDAGHFHPTEVISDKISAVLTCLDEILLHVSRGVRWDSDHVVTLPTSSQAIAQEIVRGDYLDRVHIGLDFFDASINRVAAWVIGTRNMLKALLIALLEPTDRSASCEAEGDSRPGWPCWRSSRRSPSARSGITTACRRTSRSAPTGWPRSRRTSATSSSKRRSRQSGGGP